MLTVEISESGDIVEIHGDEEGLSLLVAAIESARKAGDHEHIATESWGGKGLDEDKQGEENTLVNMLSIYCWSSFRAKEQI